ncbi:hypothetical protein LTS17_011098 [Exophiala oligosperma]
MRLEAVLSKSLPPSERPNDRRVNPGLAMANDVRGLFQSFTLQMERVDDGPSLHQDSTATRPPPEPITLRHQSTEPSPVELYSTRDPYNRNNTVNQGFIGPSLPQVPQAYPARDTSMDAQPSHALTVENLGAVDLHLPTLPPTPSSHHEDTATKIASVSRNTPRSDSNNCTSVSPAEDDGTSTAPPEQELTYEYHGPGSFLSICSRSGIDWVNEKTGNNDFGTIARGLISDVSRALKLKEPIPTVREPEPEEVMAWKYCRIYFDLDPDAAFGIVSRPSFENALRAHFRKDDGQAENQTDPGWYALRYTVYAAGCRILEMRAAAKGSRVDMMANQSWKYFTNALSVHNDILYYRTSLMAVQALAAMAFFVEAIGYPAIDYMLCSSAMRLAVSKGLHRQPPAGWKLGAEAIRSRSMLWWAIYGYERMNANRSGRPLCTDDRDITCQIPIATGDDEMQLAQMKSAIEHAKLSSDVSRRINDLKTSPAGLQEVANMISDMSQRLDAWWGNLPNFLKMDLGDRSHRLPPNINFQCVLYHHYAYYGTKVAIHAILVHPWNSTVLKVSEEEPHQREELARMTAQSREVYIDATRKFVQYLPQLDINALTPKWLVVVYPLTALVNLFIHILQNPQSPSIDSDIGLMYLIAGHFSYVEYAVAGRVFPSIGHMANLARLTVNNARSRSGVGGGGLAMDDNNELCSGTEVTLDHHDQPLQQQQQLDLESFEDFDRMHLDNEQWATLIGWPDNDDLIGPCVP